MITCQSLPFRADTIQWSTELKEINIKEFIPYDKPHGPADNITSYSLLDLFYLFFTHDILKYLADQTNLYAYACLGEYYESWDKVTPDEIRAYMGFMILMGLVQLPALCDYWRKDSTFHYEPIASRISWRRFLDIHRFLHFVDNRDLPHYGEPTYSKLQKVEPILTYMNTKFSEIFIPGKEQSIDEAMIPFKGRSSMKQYMPKKPVRRGFKIWMRADATTGYVCEFDPYTGRKGNKIEKGLGAAVVLKLTEKLNSHFHHVYFDNFFTGIDLLLDLLRRKIYACGTMRSDRRGFPTTLKSVMKKGLFQRGDSNSVQNGNLVITIWQDTKPICCASTNANPNDKVSTTRKLKNGSKITIPCPNAISQYNKFMGGVDRNDQLRGYYNVRLKSRKFYKYLFWFVFDVALTNMFVLARDFIDTPYKSIKEFRVALAKVLTGDYNSRKRRGRPSRTPSVHFCQHHFPIRGSKKCQKCFYCKEYMSRRRETMWYCKDCDKFLCHKGNEDDCFMLFHKHHVTKTDTVMERES